MNDNEIITKIKNGDQNALAEIYQKYKDEFVMWALLNHSLSQEDINEVYQMTMLIFYENIMLEKIKKVNFSLKSYLFQIGKYKIYDYYRTKTSNSVSPLDRFIYNLPDDTTHSELEEKEKKMQIMYHGLERLGTPCTSILERFYYKKQTMERIAKDLNYKNAKTVKNQKYKCLKRLIKLIKNGTTK